MSRRHPVARQAVGGPEAPVHGHGPAEVEEADSAIESVGPTLRAQLLDSTAKDPNHKVRDFVGHDGAELFGQPISKRVGEKVTQVYGCELG